MLNQVTVSAPATTANLGAGFDCLALALDLRNEVTFAVRDTGLSVSATGEGVALAPRAAQVPLDATNLVVRAAEKVFDLTGRRPLGLAVTQINAVPLGSGMGSSAATTVCGLAAANALVVGGLTPHDLLRLALVMEGHPDNAAAAIFGGLTLVSAAEANAALVRSLPTPPLTVVIALPAFALATAEARAALPAQVPLKDAVFNIGRALFTVQALTTGDTELLQWAIADRLHQPYRRKLIPGYDAVEQAALRAGALAVALSGAGPSLIAFAAEHHAAIGTAMQEAFAAAGLGCRTFVLPVSAKGVTVNAHPSAP